MNDPLVKDLWKRINDIHCLYIESDESPDKIEYERELGALIREFLSVVPHSCKFHFTETTWLLKRSILSNPDVNFFKLSRAWNFMSKYASNLLSQPWRKEYTIIKLYSGFYKHQIEPVLLGAERLLELMGYRETQPGQLELLEPIDCDSVRVVALDALLAKGECQILRMIYDEVCKQVAAVAWKDVLEFRELYAGNPELIINKIVNKFYQTRQHCRSNSYGTACALYPASVQCNGYASSIPLHTTTYLPPSTMNGYYCQHYGVNYHCNVPSGKLIDLDPPVYRTSDSYSRSPLTSSDEHNLAGPRGLNHKPRDESWGYVLDTLDKPSTSSNNSTPSNGADRYMHSNGETNRVLECMKTLRLEENQMLATPTASPDEVEGVGVRYRGKEVKSERYRRDSEREKDKRELERDREKERDRERQERDFRKKEREGLEKMKETTHSISPDMQYDTVVNESRNRRGEDTGLQYAGLTVNLTPETSSIHQGCSKSSDGSVKSSSESGSNSMSRTWDCEHCTYRNNCKKDICEICGKSKNSAVEIKPLESGGKQCPQCTLVNDKEARKCEACDTSLEHSATYI